MEQTQPLPGGGCLRVALGLPVAGTGVFLVAGERSEGAAISGYLAQCPFLG